jgi:RNA polymerase sigma-70 factor (ECF subfamily)
LTQPFSDDVPLVNAALAGDVAAYGRLYDRHARLVRAVCYDATGDLVTAQDLAQEVFLRAHQKLPTLREPQAFLGWLLTIARLVGREWRRRCARDRHLFVGLAPPEPEAASANPDVIPSSALYTALQALPARERLAVHLHYFDQYSPEACQAALGGSRSTFYRLLRRAKKRLRQSLSANMKVQ